MKINPRKKSADSQFVKLNLRKKKIFFLVFSINKTYIFTLDSLTINDGQKYFTGYEIIEN